MKKLVIAVMLMVGFVGTTMAQSKVGHVDSQVLLDTLPSSEVAGKQLQEFQKELQLELQNIGQQLQKLYADMDGIQKSANPSEVLIQLKQKAISEKETEYQKRQQEMQYEYQALQAELQEPIFERIKEAVEIVAKREKYDYIVNVTEALYVNPATDITDAAVVEVLKLEKAATTAATTPKPTTPAPGQ